MASVSTHSEFTDENFRERVSRQTRMRVIIQIALGFGFPLALLLLWELLVAVGYIDRRFFPAPSTMAVRMAELLADPVERGRLLVDIGATYYRLLWGFGLGATAGVVAGVAMGLSSYVRYALNPFVTATFPTPKLVIFPLLIVIFGLGDASKIALVALGVFYMTCISTLSGVLYSNPIHKEMAQAFRVPPWKRWTSVVIPSAMPSIVNGLKLGLGQALILVISSEFLSSQQGLGFFIWSSWQVLDLSRMFLGLFVVAITGGAAVLAGSALERQLIPWASH